MKNFIFLLVTFFMVSFGYSQELVTNGNFEAGVAPWVGNAANVVTEGGNSYNSANVTAAGNPWEVNLSQVLSLTNGQTYTFKFDAWSDRSRTMIVGIGLNQDPWSAATQTVNLTTTSQTFTFTLTAPATSANSRVIFDMGAAVGFVGIDNVSLMAVTTTCNNGVKDGDETGVDCGGSTCAPCIVPPPTAAPTPPARAASDVVSIYSDAYTNITFDNFDAGWCGGAASTAVTIAGNNTLKKNTGVDCHGINFESNRKDLTAFTHLHFDFYITDTDLTGDVFNVKLVDFAGGAGEASSLQVNINGGTTPQLVANQWVSVDVPITALGGVVAGSLTRSNVAQFVISNPNVSNVWYDNIYLHKNTVLGVNDAKEVKKARVYPNPVLAGEMVSINENVKSFEIFDLNGRKVKSASSAKISSQGLAKGIYMVKVTNDKGVVSSTKLIVK